MNRNRFLVEIVTLASSAALLLGLGLASLGVGVALAFAESPAQRAAASQKYQASRQRLFSGVVSDSMCGAKHDTEMNQSAARCTLVCLKKGARFALIDGDKVYNLNAGSENLDRVAGERVTVTGTLDGDTINVNSVDAGRR